MKISLSTNPEGQKLTDESKIPIISYEVVTTKENKTLTLMIIRIPINSKIFEPKGGQPAISSSRKHHILGFACDITENDGLTLDQLSRSVWASLLNASADSIYLKTANGEYKFINSAFAASVCKKREDIIGRKASEIFSDYPKLLAAISTEDEALVKNGIGITQAFRERLQPSGEIKYESSTKIAISDREGVVQYILGISRDISKQMESFKLKNH